MLVMGRHIGLPIERFVQVITVNTQANYLSARLGLHRVSHNIAAWGGSAFQLANRHISLASAWGDVDPNYQWLHVIAHPNRYVLRLSLLWLASGSAMRNSVIIVVLATGIELVSYW